MTLYNLSKDQIVEMTDWTCLITGGTSGIGKATAIALARMNWTIVFTAIDQASGDKTKKEIIDLTRNTKVNFFVCNLASFESIRKFCSEFSAKHKLLHVLINNAGVLEMARKESKNGIEMTFAVNYLAPFLLTSLLEPQLKESAPSRIINVTSRSHLAARFDFNDIEGKNSYRGVSAYAQSKLALVSWTKYLADKLESAGVTVNSVHPGRVNTPIINSINPFVRSMIKLTMVSPSKGAEPVVYLATSDDVSEITGAYFMKKKLSRPSRIALDTNNIKQLIDLSNAYVSRSTRWTKSK